MFNTIKAKINLYKWGFISLSVLALTIAIAVQTVRLNTVKTEAEHFQETMEEQAGQITELTTTLTNYRQSTDKAIADLGLLRDELRRIEGDTKDLKNQASSIPKIAKGGANSAELQTQANELTEKVYNRLEEAARGKK